MKMSDNVNGSTAADTPAASNPVSKPAGATASGLPPLTISASGASPVSGPPPLTNVPAPASPVAGTPPLIHASDRERAKSKRTRVILVIVILLLVAALGGLVYLGYTLYLESTAESPSGIKPGATVVPDGIVDPSAPGEVTIEETSIPNLTGLFGLTIEEVKAKLGSDFQLIKTDSATEETNPAIKQLATFSYIPSVSGDGATTASSASLPTESIYASLDEGGKVIDIYYLCDMRLLGYPDKSFDELLASSDLVAGVLSSAGVEPMDFSYNPPNPEESVVYDNPNSENRKVVKQSQIFSGRISSETLPTAWTLTVTYDFGTGVASTADFRQATRMINLKLA
jgi:hypothetical protein